MVSSLRCTNKNDADEMFMQQRQAIGLLLEMVKLLQESNNLDQKCFHVTLSGRMNKKKLDEIQKARIENVKVISDLLETV